MVIFVELGMVRADYERSILEVLNSIDVEDFSIVSDELEYVLIDDTLANQVILDTIAIISQSDYDVRKNTKQGYINIASLGLEFADRWSSSEGFRVMY